MIYFLLTALLVALYSVRAARRDLKNIERRIDHLAKVVPQFRLAQSEELPGDEWEPGTFRGKPARRNKRTNFRYQIQTDFGRTEASGPWSRLGLGYEDEFKPASRGLLAGLLYR